jgi:hypothetical protein
MVEWHNLYRTLRGAQSCLPGFASALNFGFPLLALHYHSALAGQSSKSYSKHCQCPGSPALLKDSNSGLPGFVCTQMEYSAPIRQDMFKW